MNDHRPVMRLQPIVVGLLISMGIVAVLFGCSRVAAWLLS